MMRKMQKQKGFTIIELVVVILLLGILTATALPRFMDVTAEAHDAAVSGVVGGLSTGVGLYRAQWFGKGQPNAGTVVPGFGNGSLVTNAGGYPIGLSTGTNSISDSTDCFDVFANVLQGGAPTMTTVSAAGSLTNSDIPGTVVTDYIVNLISASETCEYAYVGQFQDTTVGTVPVIRFDTAFGDVVLGAVLP